MMMKKIFANLNYLLLLLMIIYTAFGCLMIFSASSVSTVLRYGVSTDYFVVRQIIALVLAYVAGFFVLFVPTTSRLYKWLSYVIYAGILWLAGLFIYGKVAGGALSWFEIGNRSLQPAEFVKLMLILFFAVYYSGLQKKKNKINFLTMMFPMGIAILVCGLVLAQPDLGGAIIIAAISMLVFFSLPFGKKEKWSVVKLGIGGVAIVAFLIFICDVQIIKPYQMQRFDYAKPCTKYSLDTGYQVCNGYIAIHNGGLGGVGLGNSTQKYLYLPEAHTDFIFPIICEELGLVVGIAVIVGYFVMLFIMLKIAKETDNLRSSILAYGIFCYFLIHILVNLLGVLGLIPLTGVPLPFLSYGGSYNLCVVVSLFVLQRIHYENREAKLRRKIENL
ncbi:MAG: FtsW/RodA/SpoVE family cell cycle protein [Firmicutes bacterium]|nr:FtsW/RodA/SpoVE family cell cycle protein [Bacillota bacterium]